MNVVLRSVLAAAFGLLSLVGKATSAQTPQGPTFTVPDAALGKHVSVIVYGDMRFHDPSDTTIANPRAREELVRRIADLHPSAVQLTGDVPYRGSDPADYANFKLETQPWQAAGLRIYPAMGNHELSKDPATGLENWWTAFPELRGKRWYSVALGSRITLIQLDSMSDLAGGSPQRTWLDTQLRGLPRSVDFVLIGLHHPPVADIQTRVEIDHNPRPNEIALRDYLTAIHPQLHAEIMVTSGHIHNYERASVGGVTYLVSGGGGAHPYPIDRTPQDAFQNQDFPNFHYIQLDLEPKKLKATMFRLADPTASPLVWQQKDHFELSER